MTVIAFIIGVILTSDNGLNRAPSTAVSNGVCVASLRYGRRRMAAPVPILCTVGSGGHPGYQRYIIENDFCMPKRLLIIKV